MQWMPFNCTCPKADGMVMRFALIHLMQKVSIPRNMHRDMNDIKETLSETNFNHAQTFALVFLLVFVFAIRTWWFVENFYTVCSDSHSLANICFVFIGILSSFVRAATLCANIKIQLLFLSRLPRRKFKSISFGLRKSKINVAFYDEHK